MQRNMTNEWKSGGNKKKTGDRDRPIRHLGIGVISHKV